MHIDEAPIGYVGWILVQSYDADSDKFVVRGSRYREWSGIDSNHCLCSEDEYLRGAGGSNLAEYSLLIECKKTVSGWELTPRTHWRAMKELPLI